MQGTGNCEEDVRQRVNQGQKCRDTEWTRKGINTLRALYLPLRLQASVFDVSLL